MNVYILRHGLAAERGPAYANDSKRPLTPEGEKKIRRIGKVMAGLDLELDVILTSPFVRARRTAELVAAEMDLQDKLLGTPHLAVDGKPSRLIGQINELNPIPENVLLVGHEPYLSHLMARLLTGSSQMQINLKKGGLAKLVVETLVYDRCATLEWLLTPKQLLTMR